MPNTFELKISWSGSLEDYVVFRANLDELVQGNFIETQDDVNLLAVENELSDVSSQRIMSISLYRDSKIELCSIESQLNSKFQKHLNFELSEITEDWKTSWQNHFKRVETQKFELCMPWQPTTNKEKIRIEIEPALAFGTGQHETTKLCLEALESLSPELLESNSLLDIGTGSGILAIGASKLGVKDIFATEIDKDAVEAAIVNAKVNHVDNVSFECCDAPKYSNTFGVILANILKPALLELKENITSLSHSGTVLIMSGITLDQIEEMVAEYVFSGFCLKQKYTENDWACLEFLYDTHV